MSPDGKWVAYVSWDDKSGGHVWKMPLRGRLAASGAQPQQLTTRRAAVCESVLVARRLEDRRCPGVPQLRPHRQRLGGRRVARDRLGAGGRRRRRTP